ncbi:hypothetical protein EHO59_12825 [Leptospira semungkisensis]|uniref:Uncharacterized protein n=1 Tax=Leptospira semungkisensis TaxID=2484985 RepID=A0A4R9FQF8_9LEPT|nr:hypothetical protein [Leptospira semungkisensis]TGK00811.1 hypothetical protein EHO59_12825 [Leptospira semungkisensis]
MNIFKVLIIYSLGVVAFPAFSQVEQSVDCFSQESNTPLRNLSKQDAPKISGSFYTAGHGKPAFGLTWASSYWPDRPGFNVNKTAPAKSGPKYDEWAEDTCRFNAYKAQDLLSGTMWCAGGSGKGIGEVLMGYIDLKKDHFYILPGVQDRREKFEAYSRPSEIIIHYLLPTKIGISQNGAAILSSAYYFSSQSIKLSSEPGYQEIKIDRYKELLRDADKDKSSKFGQNFALVAIEIVSVIEGKKVKDHACIAEIGNLEPEGSYKSFVMKE